VIEPVELANFFTVFFSAAMVILCGALYALLFAYSQIHNMPRLMWLAYASYSTLAVSVFFLGDAANLFNNDFWTFIVGLMLVGYLLAPRMIWKLCVGTHTCEQQKENDSLHYSNRSTLL
jgi:FlaA1/EpsC-like NDP-sugar epimerase